MKVFLDANVLVSVLNKEYPVFTNSSRILSLASSKRYQMHTSALAMAIAFFYSSKKSGQRVAKKKISILLDNIRSTVMNEAIAKQAIRDKRVHDFEDGLQYYSAMHSKCEVIVTEDASDFYFSDIPVVGCEAFMMNYAE